jgi:Tol biopolymer transport system component
MTAARVTFRAILAAFMLTGIFPCVACRGGGPEEESTTTLPTSRTMLEAATAVSGRIVFQSDLDGDDDIYLLQGRQVTKLTDNAWPDRYPRWSPDGSKIAYVANPTGNFEVFTMDDRGGRIAPVTDSPEDEIDVSWAPDGMGIACSVEVKKALGKERSVWLIDLATGKRSRLIPGFFGPHQLPDLSPQLPQVVFTGKKGRGWDVFLFDLKDRIIREMTRGGKSCRPRFSPDGERIAYVSHEADGKGDIWVMEADGSNHRRLTVRDDAYDYFPSWSPDGTQIVFCSNLKDKYADKGEWGLYVIDVPDGLVTLLFDSPGRDVFPDWH